MKLRTIQILAYALVAAVTGVCVIYAGFTFMTDIVVDEARLRVQMDLNSAWTAYRDEAAQIQANLSLIAQKEILRSALSRKIPPAAVTTRLEELKRRYNLDFLILADKGGNVLAGSTRSVTSGNPVRHDPVIDAALAGDMAQGTVLIPPGDLRRMGGGLAERAYIHIVRTEKALPRRQDAEDRGLALETAAPILGRNDETAGILYGGVLLSRRYALVDTIRNSVFGSTSYKGKPVGTVTIFLWDVRIATNVIQADSTRAVGTRVSEEVYRTVLERGERFNSRAFVVNDWYLSAYDPIRDPNGQVIGMLYVGLLEQKYLDIRSDLVQQFLIIGILGLMLSIGMAVYFSERIRRPIMKLVEATRLLSSGRLDTRVEIPGGSSEALELAQAFNAMAESLETRNRELQEASVKLKKAYTEADEKNHAYMEMLGFVTHELKSPLASIVFGIASLRERLLGPLNEQQATILKACSNSADYLNFTIGNFLNLGRIEEGGLKLKLRRVSMKDDISDPVAMRLSEMAADNGMFIRCEIPPDLELLCDPDLVASVFQNLVSNAVKYGKPGSYIIISVKTDRIVGMHNFSVYNQGPGFNAEQSRRLFEKFSRFTAGNFSTKSGTGLGLFVTKNIVRMHGGAIRAESAPGRWARFIVSLPIGSSVPEEPEGDGDRE